MEILDCTLRDGGYYTRWNFSKELVNNYLRTVSKLPINNIELGYFSNNKDIIAKGDKLFMDVKEKFVSIEGNVEFTQGDSIIRAEKINVDLETETVDFEGIKNSFIRN